MRRLGPILFGLVFTASAGAGAELQPRTIDAFEQYVQLTEERIRTEVAGEAPFLWLDRLPEADHADVQRRLAAGEVVVERLHTRKGGDDIDIPAGLVHHWVGTVLIPGVSLERTMAMVRDYDRYGEIYTPNVRTARVLSQDGDRYTVFAQLFMKKVVTVVLDTEYEAEFIRAGDRRMYVPSRTTRIQELENVDRPDQRAKPIGNDRGFLWRFNNYCSFEERSEGTYMQCESLSLSRGIPMLLGFIVRPFVTGVPRESMTFTLEAARRHLAGPPE